MGLNNMQAMNDAGMQHDGYEFSDWILLEWIARRKQDGKKGIQYFTLEFMLSDLPLSGSTIKRSLTRLEERGTISVERLKRYKPSYNLAITHTGYLYALENKHESKQSVGTLHTRSAELSPLAGNGHAAHSNGHAAHSQNGNGHAAHSNGHAAHSPPTHKGEVKEVKSVKEIERLAADASNDPPTATPDGVIRESGESVQSMKIRKEDATAPVSLERDLLPEQKAPRDYDPFPKSSDAPQDWIRGDDRAERRRTSLQLRRI